MKRIAVVTGSRAEYGLLKPLIVALQRDNAFELKLLVTETAAIENTAKATMTSSKVMPRLLVNAPFG